MATVEKVILILKALSDYYIGKFTVNAKTHIMWQGLMPDIPDDILELATKQYMRENDWPPNGVAKIIEIANKLMQPQLPDWSEAWKECIEYINKFSWEQDKGFSHPMIEEAYNRIGNWDNLQSDDVPTVRAQFRQTYEQLIHRAESEIKLLPAAREVSEKYRIGVGELTRKLEAKNGKR